MAPLPSLRVGLLVHYLDDQVLVYDRVADRVHLLDHTTARVFDLLGRHDTDREALLAELRATSSSDSAEALLALAIDELRKADLFEQPANRETALPQVTRRLLLNKIAAAGATALLIPAIATLAATDAGGQSTCIPIGSPCTADAQCCIGTNGGRHCHHIGTDPPGNFCHNT